MGEHAPVAQTVVVFSKDRALQLDGTLRSLILNCQHLGVASTNVLYVASNEEYAAGYRSIASEFPWAKLHKEVDFKDDLVRLVSGSDFVLFLVDDSLFVGAVSLRTPIEVLQQNEACLGFSYRLGRNTRYCYPLDRPQKTPALQALGSGVFEYRWVGAEHDYGYPLELSSSLYRSADMLPLLRRLTYSNPNTLEAALAEHAASFAARRPKLAIYEQSVAVSIPANRVQTSFRNRAATTLDSSAEVLQRRYAAGDRLDVGAYQGLISNACHEELEFVFTTRPRTPKVSVVIPCFEQASYLRQAVLSVLAQTLTDWEIVIVDDGSPDDTAAVAADLIATYPQHQISLIRQENLGPSAARNAGIRKSAGQFILPLDADDMVRPTMLEETVRVLESNLDVSIVYTDQEFFGEAEHVVRLRPYDPDVLRRNNLFAYCSLFRRGVWEAVGGYNPNMSHGYEDWDFWVGAAEHGFRAQHHPEPLFQYRVSASGRDARARTSHAKLVDQIRANHPQFFAPRRRGRTGRPSEAPLVSILTPTFNHRWFLERCLESTIGQTETRWEQIVIDDGSTDGTEEVANSFDDPRIRYVRQEHRGIDHLGETYNTALGMARADLVAILEGDDFWPPNKLELQLPTLDPADVVLSWGRAAETDEFGNVSFMFPPPRLVSRMRERDGRDTLRQLLGGNFIPACTVILRRSAVETTGGFWQPDGVPFVDYPTWMQLCSAGRTVASDALLGFWRRHGAQVTVQMEAQMTAAPALDWATLVVTRLSEPGKRALNLSIEKARELDGHRNAELAFGFGRLAQHRRDRGAASNSFQSAIRRGSTRTRIKALLALAALTVGIDPQPIVAIRDKVRNRAFSDEGTVETSRDVGE